MKRIWVVVLLSFGLATSAAAQRTTGQIIGKVVDESGSVLPGVTVTLRGAGVAGAPTVVTSEAGVYRFPVLPPGTYAVEYAIAGFSTVKRDAIPVEVGSVVELDISMKVGALEESVTVSGASPVVDLASSEVSTAYNREWVENAPVRRFSYFDLINSAPGVSATSNVGQSTSAQSLGCFITRKHAIIRPQRGHRIKGIGHRHDSRAQRDRFARQTIGVAAAIPALVMVAHDRPDRSAHPQRLYDPLADQRMLLHHAILGWC